MGGDGHLTGYSLPSDFPNGMATDAELAAHAALDTGVHGAGESTLATAADIATHAALTTGAHGAGENQKLAVVPTAVPELPAAGVITAQDLAAALVAMGLCTQAA